jgi:hypothetical protein
VPAYVNGGRYLTGSGKAYFNIIKQADFAQSEIRIIIVAYFLAGFSV